MRRRRSPVLLDRSLFAPVGFLLALAAFSGTARAQAPIITTISAPRQVVTINQNLTLTVAAAGAASFQWKRNGLPISGATTANYSMVGAVPVRDNGWYQVIASNNGGSTTSAVVFVNVSVDPAQVVGNGYNEHGQATVPSGLNSVVALAEGISHSLALKSDGTVVGWGSNADGQITIPTGLSGVVAVAGGFAHSLALKSDGTVVGWGSNAEGGSIIPSGLSNVVAVSAGFVHSLALKNDGTVVAWGSNRGGQTTIPNGLTGVVAISAGYIHSLALKSDGSVVAWGSNEYRQSTVPSGLSNVVAVAAGGTHSLALKSDGTVVAWGYNSDGQGAVPSSLNNVVEVAAGFLHNLALKADGTVFAWGYGSTGQTTIPSGLGTVQKVAVGSSSSHNLFLANRPPLSANAVVPSKVLTAGIAASFTPVTGAGGLVPYSYGVAPALPAGLALNSSTGAISGTPLAGATAAVFTITITDAVAATASQSFTLAVNNAPLFTAISAPRQVVNIHQNLTLAATATGVTSYQWKHNGRPIAGATNASYAIIGAVPVRDNGWYQVTATNSSGSTTSAVIFVNVVVSPAQVLGTGRNNYEQTTIPTGLDNVAAVAAGGIHSLALKGDGTVVGWGSNGFRQTSIPPTLSGVVAIAAGDAHSLALKSDGTVVAWGNNEYGRTAVPGDLSGVVAVAAGVYHSLALKSDGTVAAWGDNGSGQRTVPNGLTGVVALAATAYHNLALKSDGTVVGWGHNGNGQISIPSGLSGVVAVATGSFHSIALKSDGSLVGWGSNDYGQYPTSSDFLRNGAAVAAGDYYSLVLKSDRTVVGWGRNFFDELGFPAGMDGVVMMSAGSGFYCHNLFVRDATADLAPTITSTPFSRVVNVGAFVTLDVATTGAGVLSYQWKKDGVALTGETRASYTLSSVQPSAAGVYSVTVSNAVGQVTATIATLTLTPLAAPDSRLANVSVRSGAGTGDQTLIVGLAIGGTGSKQVLIRGIGPGLTQFGVTGALPDPQIRLFNSASIQTHLNDDWGGGTTLVNAFAAAGAFGLAPASKDAALLVPLAAGSYSAQITAGGAAGTALVEAYDSDAATTTARLVNLSVRTHVGTGDNILIVGFVVVGNVPKNLLIRAIGPGLTSFGVGGVLADPQLGLFKSGVSVATELNDNWGGTPALTAAFTANGAFSLAPASRDAALVIALPPGGYTVQVSGVGGATGVALVEVYESP
jgi:alpha-tubulin suppressor-like RCC1 family protein